MKTISENVQTSLEIKKSNFITYLYNVETKKEIEAILNKIKKEHSEATHCCYAYILENEQKQSDDGEPSGTAGLPIQEVLLKKQLSFILAVVVRYFGGIKLGAGGLIRAYSKSVRNALECTELLSLVEGYVVELSIPYEEQKQIEYLLKSYWIIEQKFTNFVYYKIAIPKEDISSFKKYNIKILEEKWIKL